MRISTVLVVCATVLVAASARRLAGREWREGYELASRETRCDVCNNVAPFTYQYIEHDQCDAVTYNRAMEICTIKDYEPGTEEFDVCMYINLDGCQQLMYEISRGSLAFSNKLCRHWCASRRLGDDYAPKRRLIGALKRRLFKAHGRWCGPNWTNGRKIASRDFWIAEGRPYSFNNDWDYPAVDSDDRACRTHDLRCAKSSVGCCQWHDVALARSLNDSPWIALAMKLASKTRKC